MQKSKESTRTAYKNAWRKEKKDSVRIEFEKIQNVIERATNAGNTRGLTCTAYMRQAVLDALERDGY